MDKDPFLVVPGAGSASSGGTAEAAAEVTPKKEDRKHKSKTIISPEDNKKVKAWFVPDNESGIWRGEYGHQDSKQHAESDYVDDERLDSFRDELQVKGMRCTGKTMAQIEALMHKCYAML